MGMHKGMCGEGRENGGPSTPDVYLRDYIARKTDKPKLTFEQWLHQHFAVDAWELSLLPHLKACWKAAQENV